ncbi:MAG: ABC transporter substrate-binding protein [Lachnospiraceae bacterium]|jgi:sulfonate transport system substrate-binding protein|nr:ABC transporter substrate-binding protein [Lachnospiraceae bacterium]MCI9383622.1 ABC transporter substrate-binding protein [Lachnospiraceae bacterium]
MKRRMTALLLTVALAASLLSGCSKKEEPAQEGKPQAEETKEGGQEETALEELPVLRVAVMPFYISSPIGYIMDNKLDEANGFKIEPVMFPTGAPMNEAIAADSYDVATIGGAFVFGVANFDAHVIASHINGTGGNEIWAYKDSPLAGEKGVNPDYPEVLGSPETVKGVKIVQTTGTTGQLAVTKWLEAVGVPEEEVEMVHMEFAQCYQAFKGGQADVAALTSPYCFQTDDTMVKVADLDQLGLQLYEEITITDKAYSNPEIKAIIPAFLKTLYAVNDELEADPAKKFEAVKKWYNDNGGSATDEDIQAECDLKPFVTTEEIKSMNLGDYEAAYAEFMVSQDKLEQDKVEVVKNNVTSEFIEQAFQ